MNIKIFWNSIDRLNFILIFILGLLGVLLSFTVNQNFLFINRHTIFFILGMLIILFLSQQNNKNIRRIALFGFIILIILLLSLYFFEYEVKGSKRWLRILSFSFQPSEVVKPFFIILTSWGISQSIKGKKYFLLVTFVSFLALILLVLLQPDLGMTILIASTFFCQLFIAGLPMMLVLYGLALILFLSVSSYFFLDHVKNRIDSFLGNADTYQIDLSLKAFKSGGIFGKGPGQGDLKEKIPDANTDFIFAVAGEELGLIFCLIILMIILAIVIKTLLKVLKVDNPYKIIAISGLICSFGLQSLINIFSALGMIPTKGMTLPFVSYGGSSMLATSILFGFLLSLTNINNEEE
ncbi:FtsW/RodA/SpoVE family cell cycle protein [Alphaproteobacteria bacterium]|nr:FtsW/RodA/SpoVE family cell cycle protein [Alphaproteobacteria bacterium]MDC0453142.1 FtsW/RodA/SpoVE family cell cycle protein [Alphaproteobacteria bacterium]